MTHTANRYPEDASPADIAAALEGCQLFNPELSQRVDQLCRRCEQKNRKRRMADVDQRDAHLKAGEKIILDAAHGGGDERVAPHWHIVALYHPDHAMVDMDDTASLKAHQVRACARLHETDAATYLVDVDVGAHSPASKGHDISPVQQRRRQYIDHSTAHPDSAVVIDVPPEEPLASWPDEDRRWLEALVESEGPLEQSPAYLGLGINIDDSDDDDDDDSGIAVAP